MAKDVSNKSATNRDPDDNSSSAISDQQKVPPLRIVLNTSGNQKSSSSAIAVSNANPDQKLQLVTDKTQDAKNDGVKSGGRVRIKLGTSKQVSGGKGGESANEETSQNNKSKQNIDNTKEEINASFGHLRRITRRSQRSAQTVTNDDEESKSSMTSIDENLNTNNTNITSDNTNSQDNTTQGTSSNQQTSATSNNSNNPSISTSEPSRKYKRKRGEPSESQSCDPHDGPFGFQSYKLPGQNSIQLFKNIRRQIDKRLQTLSDIHMKSPHGFKDYMMTTGAYLLDGNKLGNGTNLFMNDEGGLHTVPMGKYHALSRNNRVTYSVPNRAKVPLGLPINSPLYNLFIEQERERYKMQIQHIKEREKLTLAAEQEMIRVHNQATMNAAEQTEPFSACTMLKHQEIYNYTDADGVINPCNEDAQSAGQPNDTTNTSTRNKESISPTKGNNNSEATNASEEQTDNVNSGNKKREPDAEKGSEVSVNGESKKSSTKSDDAESKAKTNAETEGNQEPMEVDSRGTIAEEDEKIPNVDPDVQPKLQVSENKWPIDQSADEKSENMNDQETKCDAPKIKMEPSEKNTSDKKLTEISPKNSQEESMGTIPPSKDVECSENQKNLEKPDTKEQNLHSEVNESEPTEEDKQLQNDYNVPAKQEDDDSQVDKNVESNADCAVLLSDEDKKVHNKNIFVKHLQEVDDKWEKIRKEMFIRHRNEADSLYAVQKLEWEWKTKEIGLCDVRTTPIIDNTLVPRLNIYTQDY